MLDAAKFGFGCNSNYQLTSSDTLCFFTIVNTYVLLMTNAKLGMFYAYFGIYSIHIYIYMMDWHYEY